jgi:hypothetical protein
MKPHRTSAKLILHDKVILGSGVIVEIKIWEVWSDRYPDGYKYSLYGIYGGKVLVGYDNHHPKGHHRHIGDVEMEYGFSGPEKLRNDFKADLERQMAMEGLL